MSVRDENLPPCPCGGKAVAVQRDDMHSVACLSCETGTKWTPMKSDARAEWRELVETFGILGGGGD